MREITNAGGDSRGDAPTCIHCSICGAREARLIVPGELSCQYLCGFCGGSFERERPPSESAIPFTTSARWLTPITHSP